MALEIIRTLETPICNPVVDCSTTSLDILWNQLRQTIEAGSRRGYMAADLNGQSNMSLFSAFTGGTPINTIHPVHGWSRYPAPVVGSGYIPVLPTAFDFVHPVVIYPGFNKFQIVSEFTLLLVSTGGKLLNINKVEWLLSDLAAVPAEFSLYSATALAAGGTEVLQPYNVQLRKAVYGGLPSGLIPGSGQPVVAGLILRLTAASNGSGTIDIGTGGTGIKYCGFRNTQFSIWKEC